MNAQEILAAARAAGRSALLEPEAKVVLQAFGVATPRSIVIGGEGEIDRIAELRAPYALKIVSSEVLHKSDVGGVRLALRDRVELRDAIAEMRDRLASTVAPTPSFLVEEMSPPGVEIVIGGTIHPQFGPVLMVGLGGIFVEIVDDVAFRLCPIVLRDARAMLGELRGRAILAGARGGVAVDEEAIVAALMRIGGEDGLLLALSREIAELDINPLLAGAWGATDVDARIILAK